MSNEQKVYTVNKDAWSDGQIKSKIWLSEVLEKKVSMSKKHIIWIYGGWYSLTGFLLLSRKSFPIKHIRSFDVDPSCEPIADMINNTWVYKEWQFKAVTGDCNHIEWNTSEDADIVVNTSCEHFNSLEWFNKIPSGKMVALQSTNQHHDDEDTIKINTLKEMIQMYPLTKILFSGELEFKYPDKTFLRFMVVGEK